MSSYGLNGTNEHGIANRRVKAGRKPASGRKQELQHVALCKMAR